MRSILGLTLALSLGLAACGDKEDGDSGSDGTTDGASDGTDGASDGTDGASDGTDGASDGTDGASDGTDGASDGTDGASDGADGTDGGGGADGAAVYADTCANCHGANGNDGYAADLTIRIPAMSDAEIETLVRNGRGYMPAHDFTADEMSGLLSYLRDTFN